MLHNQLAQNQQQADELECGFELLHGQYQIESALSSGGFGITYLARDSLNRRVVIKECFPVDICFRAEGNLHPISQECAEQYKSVLRNFLREAQWLARAVRPGIVGIHQVFKENNTAYIAMEFVEGDDLVTLYEDHPEVLKNLSLKETLAQALETLSFLHELGILHRDISPDNFILGADGTLTLIDFGAASGDLPDGDGAVDPMLAVKDGYSAHELYNPDLPQKPTSDIYSLAATFHYLLTGAAPPNGQQRLTALSSGDPDPCHFLEGTNAHTDQALLASIDKALSVLPGVRFQSADEWLDALEIDPIEALKAEPVETNEKPSQNNKTASIDDDLERMLSSLIEDANDGLVPAQPKSAEPVKRRALLPVSKPKKEPQQLVDIFGEPVSNVDAWLKEQDRFAKAKRAAAKRASSPEIRDEQTAVAPSSGGFISKLVPAPLRRIFGGKPIQSDNSSASQR